MEVACALTPNYVVAISYLKTLAAWQQCCQESYRKVRTVIKDDFFQTTSKFLPLRSFLAFAKKIPPFRVVPKWWVGSGLT